MNDSQLKAYDLGGLGIEYHVIVTIVRSMGATTFEELTNLLISEENLLKTIQGNNHAFSFAINHEPKNQNQNFGRSRGFNGG